MAVHDPESRKTETQTGSGGDLREPLAGNPRLPDQQRREDRPGSHPRPDGRIILHQRGKRRQQQEPERDSESRIRDR